MRHMLEGAGFLAVLTLSAASTVAGAQVRPSPGGGDTRLQSVAYDADQVVQLLVAPGYQLTIELSPSERIENVAVGDTGAWQVTANRRGDRLFVRLAAGGAATNLTVMTDSRTYAFDLVPGEVSSVTPYIVRFTYPGETGAGATNTQMGGLLTPYRLRGNRRLWPSGMGDDGARTFMEWPAGSPLPAVFVIDDIGQEVSVDGQMRDGRYVIDTVRQKLVLRLGSETATAERTVKVAVQ